MDRDPTAATADSTTAAADDDDDGEEEEDEYEKGRLEQLARQRRTDFMLGLLEPPGYSCSC